jgi:hypothetical protein
MFRVIGKLYIVPKIQLQTAIKNCKIILQIELSFLRIYIQILRQILTIV